MRSSHRKYRIKGQALARVRGPVISIAALALVLFAVRAHASPWSNVTPPVYDPNFVVPLNTTSNEQTKLGHLTVQKDFYAAAGLTVGSAGSPMTICWNGTDPAYCRSEWAKAGAYNYATLQCDSSQVPSTCPPRDDDTGTPILLAPDDLSVAKFGLQALAPDESAGHLPGVGIEGVASADASLTSAGVAASSAADLVDHYGIYATNGGNREVWAAEFNGNLGVRGAAGESAVIVGRAFDASGVLLPDLQFFRSNNKTAVCLNGVCKSAWDSAGPSQWARNTATTPNTLWPGDPSRGLSIGKGMFTVTKLADLSAAMSITGSLNAGSMSIGTAPPGLPVSVTCGDSMCSQGENATSCPDDCDASAPAPIAIDAIDHPSPTQYIATFGWLNPPTPDFGGTRVVYNPTAPPSGPDGGTSHVDVYGVHDAFSSYKTPTLGEGTHYYYLYAYDNSRSGQPHNFSAPVRLVCSVPSSGSGNCSIL